MYSIWGWLRSYKACELLKERDSQVLAARQGQQGGIGLANPREQAVGRAALCARNGAFFP